jgi:hypothetical protein
VTNSINHVRIVKVIVLESRSRIIWLLGNSVVSVSGSTISCSVSPSLRVLSIESLVIMIDVTGTGDDGCSTAKLQRVHRNIELSPVFS